MRREKAILTRSSPVSYERDSGWDYKTEQFEVRILARAEGYAMVRRPRSTPFVCSEKDLSPPAPAIDDGTSGGRDE